MVDSELESRNAQGVRGYLRDAESGMVMNKFFVGRDGSYHLGNVRPGKYVLEVDTGTLPESYVMIEP